MPRPNPPCRAPLPTVIAALVVLAAAAIAAPARAASPRADAGAAKGRTFFVAHRGNDALDGGSQQRPFRTLAYAIARLRPGDTLFIRGAPTDAGDAIWEEGLTFRGARSVRGRPDARITISAYGDEVVRIMPRRGARPLYMRGGAPARYQGSDHPTCANARCGADSPQYITFRNIIFDGRDADMAVKFEFPSGFGVDAKNTGPHHIRFERCTMRNGIMGGVHLAAGDWNEFIDCAVHDNGSSAHPQQHGYYIASKRNLIRGGSVHRNFCMGIQLWSGYDVGGDNSDNVIEGVDIHHNGSNARGNCGTAAKNGVGIYCSARNVVRRCTIHRNGDAGVQANSGAYASRIEDNRMWSNNVLGGIAAIDVGRTDWRCGGPREMRDDLLPPELRGGSRRGGAVATVVSGNVLWDNARRGNAGPGGQIANTGEGTLIGENVLGRAEAR